jgi:hypothetical protein
MRVYDWRDVGFNATAGALLLALVNLRRWARARDLGTPHALSVTPAAGRAP